MNKTGFKYPIIMAMLMAGHIKCLVRLLRWKENQSEKELI